MSLVREGRVWKFGDNINTDLIFPNRAFRMPIAEQYQLVFSANRPGWVDQVQKGDLIVGGEDFGMGSGRPVGRLLGECGIAGVVRNRSTAFACVTASPSAFPRCPTPGFSTCSRKASACASITPPAASTT